MQSLRFTIVTILALALLACSGNVDLELDQPLTTDDAEGEEEGEEEEEEVEEEEEEEGDTVEVDLSSASATVATFAAGVNGSDSNAVEQASTAACWEGACKELVDEAEGDGFTIVVGNTKEKGDRGIARIEACEGDDCDTLIAYIENSGDEWKVAWLDEDADHGKAFLQGKADATP